MELFLVIMLAANVLLTAVCAYCLSMIVVKGDDPDTFYLAKVSKITRRLIIIGGCVFIAFLVWGIFVATALFLSEIGVIA